ncbi:MAG: hypothetical protein JW784_07335 [Candidatus Cloacimonetes bacterium]|nr:hypothetical protein [Candidatus Cloacimonadota bacterium]
MAVELHPVPMYIDTLAEDYFVLGRFPESRQICEEQLVINPQDKMFLERIERIEQILSGSRLKSGNE